MSIAAFVVWTASIPLFTEAAERQTQPEPFGALVRLRGPYMGQEPPSTEPRIFAPGVVSTHASEFGASFSKDGREFFFAVGRAPFNITLNMRMENGAWTWPQVAPFAGRYDDFDMNFSPNGESLFFTSRRPLTGKGTPSPNTDLWTVTRSHNGWSEPRNLGPPVNTAGGESYPSVARDGTLYFHRYQERGKKDTDIFSARIRKGRYLEPENLGVSINSHANEWDPFISPDGGFLIFGSVDRPGGFGGCDLYISFRVSDGAWTRAINMGEGINSDRNEITPSVSPDGKYIFFSSSRRIRKNYSKEPVTYQEMMEVLAGPGNGMGDIYWVDAGVIEELRRSR